MLPQNFEALVLRQPSIYCLFECCVDHCIKNVQFDMKSRIVNSSESVSHRGTLVGSLTLKRHSIYETSYIFLCHCLVFIKEINPTIRHEMEDVLFLIRTLGDEFISILDKKAISYLNPFELQFLLMFGEMNSNLEYNWLGEKTGQKTVPGIFNYIDSLLISQTCMFSKIAVFFILYGISIDLSMLKNG
eukprot:GHVP01005473.1.p1 GENE.GHVP01005473.1~~GHVP01005473.1.p1  ORF type:complete len:188 (+),score=19.71 GHVP01005473.1:422-985(+)